MAHVAPEKVRLVEDLASRCAEAQVIGIVNVQGIPAPQFQTIRKRLGGRATITVVKNNLLRLALEKASAKKPDLAKLGETIEGQTAVVTAEINPFRLYKELESTKTRAPARGGEVAPEDLWVRAGETPFKPGPVVGELQKAGIPAAIERGKVVIRQDKLLVKAGQRIPRDIAQQLARLEIYPLVVGLDLRGVYEKGTVFRRETLAIDEGVIRGQIAHAGREALALALAAAYPTKATIGPLLVKAFRHAMNLAVESAFPTKESIKFLLIKAQSQAFALATRIPGAAEGSRPTGGSTE
jgi:large subunit ribosomal protein L10